VQQTLATVIDVIRPVWDGVIPRDVIADARRIASELPPVAKGGFEFDLLSPLSSVDVLQCFDVADDGMRALDTYLGQRPATTSATWAYLARLVGDLLNPLRPWHRTVESVWLEIDAERFTPGNWEPSVFLEFSRNAPPSTEDLIEALSAMPLRDFARKAEAVQEVAELLSDNAWISHLGAMLAREDTPLRINIKRLCAPACAGLLSRLSIAGDASRVVEIFDDAYRSTLCIDVTDRILPRAGAEYQFTSPPARELGWRSLAERATQRVMERAPWSVMEQWNAELTPLSAVDTWPDTMILSDLAGGEDRQLVLQVIPSHIKITYPGDYRIGAKGYVGFQPRSRPLPSPRDVERASAPPPASESPSAANGLSMRDAMDRGLEFLLEARCQNGLWRDFEFACMHSDEWITGYVGAQMLNSGCAKAAEAAREAWATLRARRSAGAGWGYQKSTPPDADSTAWVLALARDLGETDAHVTRGLAFLAAHRGSRGFRTYDPDMLLKLDEALPDTAAHRKWHDEQVEITASAARAGLEIAVQDLLRAQRNDGSWEGFWIDGSEYVTGLAVEALRRSGRAIGDQAIGRAGSWARARMARESNSFKLAWLLRRPVEGSGENLFSDEVFRAAITRLLRLQQEDGSWPASGIMKVPLPSEAGDSVEMADFPDCHRVFTTSTVVGTLGRLLAAPG
jgi:hypothetical protein